MIRVLKLGQLFRYAVGMMTVDKRDGSDYRCAGIRRPLRDQTIADEIAESLGPVGIAQPRDEVIESFEKFGIERNADSAEDAYGRSVEVNRLPVEFRKIARSCDSYYDTPLVLRTRQRPCDGCHPARFAGRRARVPDTSEYLSRIRERVRGEDPLELQKRTPEVLAELVAGASDEQLRRRPAKDKWSVGEILAHLAEDEIATAWRYRQIVEHPGIVLEPFDQDLWSRVGDYASRVPSESLTLFRLLREVNLKFLRGISTEQWACAGVHRERGRITLADLVRHMAGHDANHIEQIREILK